MFRRSLIYFISDEIIDRPYIYHNCSKKFNDCYKHTQICIHKRCFKNHLTKIKHKRLSIDKVKYNVCIYILIKKSV